MRRGGWLRAVFTALALAFAVGPAAAQTKAAAKPEAAKPEPPKPAPEPPPPPYEPQLLRLAEVVGALAYLRPLCREDDGEEWRSRMDAIIAAEATTPARREKLAGAYNRGFRGYETTYRVCTANASLIISRYIEEGGKLAHEIGNRFGGG